MKVKDLIRILQTYNPESDVFTNDVEYGIEPLEEVEQMNLYVYKRRDGTVSYNKYERSKDGDLDRTRNKGVVI